MAEVMYAAPQQAPVQQWPQVVQQPQAYQVMPQQVAYQPAPVPVPQYVAQPAAEQGAQVPQAQPVYMPQPQGYVMMPQAQVQPPPQAQAQQQVQAQPAPMQMQQAVQFYPQQPMNQQQQQQQQQVCQPMVMQYVQPAAQQQPQAVPQVEASPAPSPTAAGAKPAVYRAPGSFSASATVRRKMLGEGVAGAGRQSNSSDEGISSDTSSEPPRKPNNSDRGNFFGIADQKPAPAVQQGKKQLQQQQQHNNKNNSNSQGHNGHQQHTHQNQNHVNHSNNNNHHKNNKHQTDAFGMSVKSPHHGDQCPFAHRRLRLSQAPENPEDIASTYRQWRDWWEAAGASNPLNAPSLRGARNHHKLLAIERHLLARGVPQLSGNDSDSDLARMAQAHHVSKSDLQKLSLLKHLSFGKDLAKNFNFEPYGVQLQREVLTREEERKVLRVLDEEYKEWDDALASRRTLQFGYHFDYATDNLYDFRTDIPDWLQKLSQKVKDAGQFDKLPNQVIINEYIPKQGILLHADRHCFGEYICSVSLQSEITMCFVNSGDKLAEEHAGVPKGSAVLLHLMPRAMLVMTSQARWKWQHGIAGSRNDLDANWDVRERSRRVSLTFRYVDPELWEKRRSMMSKGLISPDEERRRRVALLKSRK